MSAWWAECYGLGLRTYDFCFERNCVAREFHDE